MILWAVNPNGSGVNFTLTRLNPYGGQYDPIQRKFLYPQDHPDPEAMILRSEGKLPSVLADVFFLFLDETFFQDGQYLVSWSPVGGSGISSAYATYIKSGVELPPSTLPNSSSTTTPLLSVISGREIGLNGTGRRDVEITVSLSRTGTAYNPSGFLAGAVKTVSFIDGTWSLAVVPSTQMSPEGRYTFEIRSPEFGVKRYENLFVPVQGACDLNSLIVGTKIKDMEIKQPIPGFSLSDPNPGYCRVYGKIVNTVGSPESSFVIKIGSQDFDRLFLSPSTVPLPPVQSVIGIESSITLTTEPNKILTYSAYPGQDVSTINLPPGAEILGVISGHGEELRTPDNFNYSLATGVMTFTSSFVGIVKYRLRVGGRFQIDLPSANEYWVQLGDTPIKRTFSIPAGKTLLNLGDLIVA